MKTLRDIVAEKEPIYIHKSYGGGVRFCPVDYEYLRKYLEEGELNDNCPKECEELCWECWDREVEE